METIAAMPLGGWVAMVMAFIAGISVGGYLEARLWRQKGDHAYMNCKESGGRLYRVKREYR